MLASFSLRFEGHAFFDCLPLLLRILSYFVAFSVVICYAFNLNYHQMKRHLVVVRLKA